MERYSRVTDTLPTSWLPAALGLLMLGVATACSAQARTSNTEGTPHVPFHLRCSPPDARVWDLGTGTLSDVARLAPGFYGESLYGGVLEQHVYQRRVRALQEMVNDERFENVQGRPMKTAQGERLEFARRGTSWGVSSKPAVVRVLSERRELDGVDSVMVVGETCAHIVAEDQCIDGRFSTTVRVDGDVPCLGGHAVPNGKIVIGVGNRQNLQPGRLAEAYRIQGSPRRGTLPVYLALPGSEQVSHISVHTDDLSSATEREVISLARAGFARSAGEAFRGMSGSRSSGFGRDVATALRMHAEQVLLDAPSPAVLEFEIRTLRYANDLPGYKEAIDTYREAALKEAGKIATTGAPTPTEFKIGYRLLQTYGTKELWAALQERYGGFLADGRLNDSESREAYQNLFPDSRYTQQLEDQRKAKRVAAAETQQKAAIWSALKPEGDKIGYLLFQLQEHTKSMVTSTGWRQDMDQRQIRSLRQRISTLRTRNFCPRKRQLLQLVGTQEYLGAADGYCRDGHATVETQDGAIDATKECLEAFKTGC